MKKLLLFSAAIMLTMSIGFARVYDHVVTDTKDLTLWYEQYVTTTHPTLTATNEAGDSTYCIAPYMQCGGPAYSSTVTALSTQETLARSLN